MANKRVYEDGVSRHIKMEKATVAKIQEYADKINRPFTYVVNRACEQYLKDK